jgi:hypothetical protein
MGRVNFPFYGEDLGSEIEEAKKILAKIETNKFDNEDLADFANKLTEIADKIKSEIA